MYKYYKQITTYKLALYKEFKTFISSNIDSIMRKKNCNFNMCTTRIFIHFPSYLFECEYFFCLPTLF